MRALGRVLAAEGHRIHNVGYPSTRERLDDLAHGVAEQLRTRGLDGGGSDIGFVTHSMGGIVLRALPRVLPGFMCGRSVLLGPPINGSIIAERGGNHPLLKTLFGPALAELAPAMVATMQRVPGPFAVIAGSTWTPLLPSAHILRRLAPGQPSDSTVLVTETMAPDAAQHRVVKGTHSFLPMNADAQRLVVSFLKAGTC
jgi:hypothetical protein